MSEERKRFGISDSCLHAGIPPLPPFPFRCFLFLVAFLGMEKGHEMFFISNFLGNIFICHQLAFLPDKIVHGSNLSVYIHAKSPFPFLRHEDGMMKQGGKSGMLNNAK